MIEGPLMFQTEYREEGSKQSCVEHQGVWLLSERAVSWRALSVHCRPCPKGEAGQTYESVAGSGWGRGDVQLLGLGVGCWQQDPTLTGDKGVQAEMLVLLIGTYVTDDAIVCQEHGR